MRKSDFHYTLPPELIAAAPLKARSDSRLLIVDSANLRDSWVKQIPALVAPGDLMVFNNTQVLKARLFGNKTTGGRVEILLERVQSTEPEPLFLAQLKANKKLKPGTLIELGGGASFSVLGKCDDGFYQLKSNRPIVELFSEKGQVPLPPYIKRTPTDLDNSRYQTVYASNPGAVAAPTAGLHFDEALLQTINQQGVEFGFTTLHVGAGTFQPVRHEDIREHKMHREFCSVDEQLVNQVNATRARGGRVIAVGTTSLRALESAARSGAFTSFSGETDIFIYPGFEFKAVDVLMTNFHLPESTLIMLVAAFIGRDRTLEAYQHAVEKRYRFFSYGDAMWLTPP